MALNQMTATALVVVQVSRRPARLTLVFATAYRPRFYAMTLFADKGNCLKLHGSNFVVPHSDPEPPLPCTHPTSFVTIRRAWARPYHSNFSKALSSNAVNEDTKWRHRRQSTIPPRR